MKKIWKIRKDSKAVSPVIATILMVAITVVLAAVLYVMVMGFGGGEAQTPTGSFTTTDRVSADSYKIYLGSVSPTTDFADCQVVIENANGTSSQPVTLTSDMNAQVVQDSSDNNMAYLNVTDLAGDGVVSVGDYLSVYGDLSPDGDGSWTINLLYIDTGGSIASKTWTVG